MHTMNPVDAAWFQMDGPFYPAVVNALVLTSTPLVFERIKEVLRERLLSVGPRSTLHLAGAVVDRMTFWVPHPATNSASA